MKFCILKTALAAVSVALVTSCVSIDISESDIKKAKNVEFIAPQQPFVEIGAEDIDKGWRNNNNGNTITYVTDCENPYDPTLENIESGVISGLQNLKLLYTDTKMFNNRAGRQSIYEGSVDGIPSKVNLMIFKKNNCIFVLSYIAVVKNYAQDEQIFEKFLQGFRSP